MNHLGHLASNLHCTELSLSTHRNVHGELALRKWIELLNMSQSVKQKQLLSELTGL